VVASAVSLFLQFSVSLLAEIFVAFSLFAVFRTNVEFSCMVVIIVPSDVSPQEILTARHCHSLLIFFLPPLIPQTQELS
jgi:hypothetical protein